MVMFLFDVVDFGFFKDCYNGSVVFLAPLYFKDCYNGPKFPLVKRLKVLDIFTEQSPCFTSRESRGDLRQLRTSRVWFVVSIFWTTSMYRLIIEPIKLDLKEIWLLHLEGQTTLLIRGYQPL